MLIAREHKNIQREVVNHYSGEDIFYEYCNHCGEETPYVKMDLVDNRLSCQGCGQGLAPCDLCICEYGDCGVGSDYCEKNIL